MAEGGQLLGELGLQLGEEEGALVGRRLGDDLQPAFGEVGEGVDLIQLLHALVEAVQGAHKHDDAARSLALPSDPPQYNLKEVLHALVDELLQPALHGLLSTAFAAAAAFVLILVAVAVLEKDLGEKDDALVQTAQVAIAHVVDELENVLEIGWLDW